MTTPRRHSGMCVAWVALWAVSSTAALAQDGVEGSAEAPAASATDTTHDAEASTATADDDTQAADEVPPLDDNLVPEEKRPQQWAVDTTIERARRPFDRVLEQTLGSTSRAVGFDWRKSPFQLAVSGGELIERNNFGSLRVGVMGRRAFGNIVVEGAVHYVDVRGTQSSRMLSLTPYVQSGRPSRWEVDLNVSHPLVEGAVTPLFNFFPPMELVFSAMAGGRYLFYPRVLVGDRRWDDVTTWTDVDTWRDVGLGLFSPQMPVADQVVLDRTLPGGMQLDPALYHVLVGPTFDVYMQPGVFLTTRALVAVPILSVVTGTRLSFWPELTVALGYAF